MTRFPLREGAILGLLVCAALFLSMLIGSGDASSRTTRSDSPNAAVERPERRPHRELEPGFELCLRRASAPHLA